MQQEQTRAQSAARGINWGIPSDGEAMAQPAQPPGELDSEKVAQLLEAARRRPELPEVGWRDDDATLDPSAPPPVLTRKAMRAARGGGVESDPHTYDPERRRIRDRYIGARFAGVARSAADLENATRVIKAARLVFEEDEPALAIELVRLAIEENPHEPILWLAEIEIAYLARDAEHFARSARAFHAGFPDHPEWNQVARLGRRLVPEEAQFKDVRGAQQNDHSGPWPHTPNWIQAPYDLSHEDGAADFHRAMIDGDLNG
jgi:hypothetical protein